jgi:hypothetical protein
MMHITQLLLQFARSLPPPAPSPMPYTSPSLRPQPHSPIFPQHLPFNLNPTIQAAIARSLAAGKTHLLSRRSEPHTTWLTWLQGRKLIAIYRWTCCRCTV